jgi:Uncharacterised protein family (UPF0158)
MQTIKINWDELIQAFDLDIQGFEVQWFFDTATGGTICINEFDDEATRTREQQLVESDTVRFVQITPVAERELIDLMTVFSMDIKDKNIKELAWLALDTPNTIINFRKALIDFANTWENWKYFRNKSISQKILDFLKEKEITPENPSPYVQ